MKANVIDRLIHVGLIQMPANALGSWISHHPSRSSRSSCSSHHFFPTTTPSGKGQITYVTFPNFSALVHSYQLFDQLTDLKKIFFYDYNRIKVQQVKKRDEQVKKSRKEEEKSPEIL